MTQALPTWISENRPLARITAAVSAAHTLLLVSLLFWSSPPAPEPPKRIVVQTIALNPKSIPTPKSITKAKEAPQKEEAPPSEAPPAPAQRQSDAESISDHPQPKPEPPKPKPKPKAVPKETPKPKAKGPDKPKVIPKPTPDKPKPKQDKPKGAPKAKESPPATPKADPRKEELLRQAKAALDGIEKPNSKSNTPPGKLKSVGIPSSLKIDALDGGTSAAYADMLAIRLQQLLKLPESGSAHISLTLDRSGKVLKATVTDCRSAVNRDTLNTNLPKHTFPPFGKDYPGETTHTFSIVLKSD